MLMLLSLLEKMQDVAGAEMCIYTRQTRPTACRTLHKSRFAFTIS